VTANSPSLPVQPLQYDTASPQHSLPGLLRAIGILLIVFGALQTLTHGAQLVTWLLHLADPYYWNLRKTQPKISGLPSSYLLTAIGVVGLISGLAGLVAGFACLGRRPWARPATLAYATLEIASRVLMSAAWLANLFDARSLMSVAYVIGWMTQVTWFLSNFGFPAVLLFLFLRRHRWQTP